ncbi:MAG: putative Ig domain-containing protein [Acidimicrobiia bacterium]
MIRFARASLRGPFAGAWAVRLRSRRLVSALVGLSLAAASVLVAVPSAQAASAGIYLDRFESGTFDGSNGTKAWSGPWSEAPESDGPAAGQVKVVSDVNCSSGKCLFIGDFSGVKRAQRVADLSGADGAVLTFDWKYVGTGSATHRAEIRATGCDISSEETAGWTVLKTFTAADAGSSTFKLGSAFGDAFAMSSTTCLRFTNNKGGNSGHVLYADNVQIRLANKPVVTNPGNQSSNEGDSVSLTVAGSDPDGDALTWSATGLPSLLSINPGTGVISGTISLGADASYSVTVKATDPDGLFDEVAFTWAVNRTPVVDPVADQSDNEGQEIVPVPVTGSDPNGDDLIWSAEVLPSGVAIDSVTGVISGKIDIEVGGEVSYDITVRARDAGELFGETTFTWAVNRTPTVTNPGNQSHNEGDTISLPVAWSDPNGDDLTWTANGLPPGLSIGLSTGVISGTISSGAAATYSVMVKATDPGGLDDEVPFTWTVSAPTTTIPPTTTTTIPRSTTPTVPPTTTTTTAPDGTDTTTTTAPGDNQAPTVIDPGDQSSTEGDAVSLPVAGWSSTGTALTWSALELPSGLSIDPSTGVISGTIESGAAGSYAVTVRAADPWGLFGEVSFGWRCAASTTGPDGQGFWPDAKPGETVSTDHSGDGATPDVPLEVSVTTPTGGAVSVSNEPVMRDPESFTLVGTRLIITAPDATVVNPLVLVFLVDSSVVPEGFGAETVAVFRDGVLARDCWGPGAAAPDPCVSSRGTSGDDLEITVFSTRASTWEIGFGVAAAGLPGSPGGGFGIGWLAWLALLAAAALLVLVLWRGLSVVPEPAIAQPALPIAAAVAMEPALDGGPRELDDAGLISYLSDEAYAEWSLVPHRAADDFGQTPSEVLSGILRLALLGRIEVRGSLSADFLRYRIPRFAGADKGVPTPFGM